MARRIHLPNDVGRIVGRHGDRLGRLEHRVTETPFVPDPTSVVFTLAGLLESDVISPPYAHPTGGLLVSARCKLGTVDPDNVTRIAFERNDSSIPPVHSWSGIFDSHGTPVEGETTFGDCVILPGHRECVAFFHARRFAPNLDELTVGISAATSAESLTVRTDWGS